MAVTIYHNPRCSKSRQTLSLLQEHGVEPTIVEYLKTPPSAKQNTTGNSSLTDDLLPRSSARCRRVRRMLSAKSPKADVTLPPPLDWHERH